MVDYEDEDEVKIETENDFGFAEEHDDALTCVFHKLRCNQKPSTPRNDIKSSTQGVLSKTRYATSSSTMKVTRTPFLVHW